MSGRSLVFGALPFLLAAHRDPTPYRYVGGKPQVASALPPSTDDTYFNYQVEKQARPIPASPSLVYPEPARQANLSGQVLGQFVVDTMGLADLSTFRVLHTTNPWFTAAVYGALPFFRFVPAQIKGHKVRELIQQPYAFNVRR